MESLSRFFLPFAPWRLNASQVHDALVPTVLGPLPVPPKTIVPDYIGLAVPYFLALVAIEVIIGYLVDQRRAAKRARLNVKSDDTRQSPIYRINDTLNSLRQYTLLCYHLILALSLSLSLSLSV